MTTDETCTWTPSDDGAWETDCDEIFEFTDDGPVQHGFKYCPYCGMKLVEDIKEASDD